MPARGAWARGSEGGWEDRVSQEGRESGLTPVTVPTFTRQRFLRRTLRGACCWPPGAHYYDTVKNKNREKAVGPRFLTDTFGLHAFQILKCFQILEMSFFLYVMEHANTFVFL